MPIAYKILGPSSTAGASAKLKAQRRSLFGKDIWFDVTLGNKANLEVTANGDWATVEGREALRQSLIRRIITNPGEWATLPEFGVGARLYVKKRDTPAMRQELEERIRGQLLRDRRVASVDQVTVERLPEAAGLKIFIQVTPTGETQRNQPLTASIEVF